MDLIDYRMKYGYGALRVLANKTGLGDYIYQLSSGAKGCTLDNAKLLKEHANELDVVALMEMRARAQKTKAEMPEIP